MHDIMQKNLAPGVYFGKNLKWSTFSIHQYTWAFTFYEKWSNTVRTRVQMDRDVDFLKTDFAKSVISIYAGLQITSLDLDSSFRLGLFSKPPSHVM